MSSWLSRCLGHPSARLLGAVGFVLCSTSGLRLRLGDAEPAAPFWARSRFTAALPEEAAEAATGFGDGALGRVFCFGGQALPALVTFARPSGDAGWLFDAKGRPGVLLPNRRLIFSAMIDRVRRLGLSSTRPCRRSIRTLSSASDDPPQNSPKHLRHTRSRRAAPIAEGNLLRLRTIGLSRRSGSVAVGVEVDLVAPHRHEDGGGWRPVLDRAWAIGGDPPRGGNQRPSCRARAAPRWSGASGCRRSGPRSGGSIGARLGAWRNRGRPRISLHHLVQQQTRLVVRRAGAVDGGSQLLQLPWRDRHVRRDHVGAVGSGASRA